MIATIHNRMHGRVASHGDQTIPSLDGLRAISIVLVLIGHAIGFEKHSFGFRLLFQHAGLGVNIFFIISGFLITTLLLKERADFGSISLKLFYIRRGLRIFPAFYVFVFTVCMLNAFGWLEVPTRLWAFVLTYTVNFAPVGVWSLGHLWSLSVEEQFYLLWPLALRFAGRRMCIGIAILAVFSGILIRAVFVITGIQLIDPIMGYAFPFASGPIAMGCLLGITAPQVLKIVEQYPLVCGSRGLAVAVPLILFLDTLNLGSANRFISIVASSLLTFCISILVFKPEGIAAVLLNCAPTVLIGKLSYSLYLWQQLFFDPYSNSRLCKFPFNAFAAVALALLSYFAVEARFMTLRKHFRRQSPLVLAGVVTVSETTS